MNDELIFTKGLFEGGELTPLQKQLGNSLWEGESANIMWNRIHHYAICYNFNPHKWHMSYDKYHRPSIIFKRINDIFKFIEIFPIQDENSYSRDDYEIEVYDKEYTIHENGSITKKDIVITPSAIYELI